MCAIAKFFLHVDGVLCFWIAYILTRPLGACLGDGLSADPEEGGLGAGTTLISIIFFTVIVVLVTFLFVGVQNLRKKAEEEVPDDKVVVATATTDKTQQMGLQRNMIPRWLCNSVYLLMDNL